MKNWYEVTAKHCTYLLLIGCASKPNQETPAQDTLLVDSIAAPEELITTITEPFTKPEPIIVTDSTVNVLKNLVDVKFDSLYQLISDTSLFYKVEKMFGVVILNWSEYWKEVKSIGPLTDEELKRIIDEHDSNLSLLKTTLSKEELITSDEEVYSIEIREPKHADLVDYTYVTIPKAVYNKLRK
jgi:hypothetical protein